MQTIETPVTHLTPRELATRWHLSVSTLEHWRCTGKDPRFIRFGLRRVLYPIEEVMRFEQSRLFSSVHILASAVS